jgi:expansin (peptidoglycan-binding protein)
MMFKKQNRVSRRLFPLALAMAGLSILATACDSTGDSGSVPQDGRGGGKPTATPTTGIGASHSGQYQLGPVEWSGSFWNACGPYTSDIQTIEGGILAGVSNTYGSDGSMCDACVKITTAAGNTTIARVVTYGVGGTNDLDLSTAAFNQITQGEYPRTMSWQVVRCPTTAPIRFQFQTGSNVDWTSLWVRNPAAPVAKLEVKSSRHTTYTALRRGTDGTFTLDSGFGSGSFTLRVSGTDGSQMEATFPSFTPGEVLTASGNL